MTPTRGIRRHGDLKLWPRDAKGRYIKRTSIAEIKRKNKLAAAKELEKRRPTLREQDPELFVRLHPASAEDVDTSLVSDPGENHILIIFVVLIAVALAVALFIR